MKLKKKMLLGVLIFLVMGLATSLFIREYQESQEILQENQIEEIISQSSFNPLDNRSIGYEYLDENTLHFWNKEGDYFLNLSSGIQFTNHHEEYWTHNIFCAGYKTTQWNYKCNDELPIQLNVYSDNETYVEINGTRGGIDIEGRNIGMGISYRLESQDKDLKITTGIRLISGAPILNSTKLAFAWRVNNIQIDNTPENDKIFVNQTWYDLNESLDLLFRDMTKISTQWNETSNLPYNITVPIPYYLIQDDSYVKLRWNPNLDYFLQIKNQTRQYNSPVTLAIVTNGLNVGQTKQTSFYWRDPEGPNSPGSAEDEGDWIDPINVSVSDDIRTYNLQTSGDQHILRAYNFSFSIPTGATIDGFLVEVEGYSGEPNPLRREYDVALGKIGYTSEGDWKLNKLLNYTSTNENYISSGNSTDLWGGTWSADDVNNINFSVLIRDNDADYGTHYIDHIRVTVSFTADGDSCSPSSPLSANYQYECSDDCVISSEVDASWYNITINGTGTFLLNDNITNYNKIRIVGESELNKCVVTCVGGCFKN